MQSINYPKMRCKVYLTKKTKILQMNADLINQYIIKNQTPNFEHLNTPQLYC